MNKRPFFGWALPALLALASLTSAQVIPPRPVALGFTGSSSSPGTGIKWTSYTGWYALTGSVPVGQANSPAYGTGGAYSGSGWQTEMGRAYSGYQLTNVNGKPSVVGYALFLTWGALEVGTGTSGPGTYQFGPAGSSTYFIDQLMNDARAKGLKVFWAINPNLVTDAVYKQGPSNTNESNTAPVQGICPQYTLNNASLYGAPDLGTNGGSAYPSTPAPSGFYIENAGAYACNITNTNDAAALEAMVSAIATDYDSDPAFGGIIWETTDMAPDTGTTALATYWTAYTNLILASKADFTQSNVFVQMGFGGTATQQMTQTLASAGVLISSSDTAGSNLFANTIVPINSFTYTNSGGTSSGTFVIPMNIYNSWYGTLVLSNAQQLPVAATETSSGGGNVDYSWTSTTTVTSSVTSSATMAYSPRQLSGGVQAFFNLQAYGSTWSPLGTPLYSISPYVGLVEEPDFIASSASPFPTSILPTPQQLAESMQNSVASGDGYGAGMGFFASLTGVSSPDNWGSGSDGQVLNQLKNYPISSSCPAVYASCQ